MLHRPAIATRPSDPAPPVGEHDSGRVSSPTINATTLLSEPRWESDSAHSAFRNGNTALRTWRDM